MHFCHLYVYHSLFCVNDRVIGLTSIDCGGRCRLWSQAASSLDGPKSSITQGNYQQQLLTIYSRKRGVRHDNSARAFLQGQYLQFILPSQVNLKRRAMAIVVSTCLQQLTTIPAPTVSTTDWPMRQ
jgi:hypothetical protein